MIVADISPEIRDSIKSTYEVPSDDTPTGFTRDDAHYFRDVSHIKEIDIYRVLDLFCVTHPCAQHAIKKLMVAGQRGVKDVECDVQEAGRTINRWLQMISEEKSRA